MTETLLVLGAFVATILLGVPFLSMVHRAPRFRRPPRADAAANAVAVDAPPAFAPLVMAPFALAWPSEMERPLRGIPEPPWPSETWDDEYFGARARGDLAKARKAVADAEENRRRVTAENAASLRKADAADPSVPDEPALSQAEIAALVRDLGLAGAVEEIRDRTGWDFKTAAQFLANSLRK